MITAAAPHTHYHHRQMEEALAVFGLTQSLHARVASRAEPDISAALRAAVAEDERLSKLVPAVRRSLFRAAGKTTDRATQRSLLALCREDDFGRLNAASQRRLLDLIAPHLDPRVLADVTAIVRSPSFATGSVRFVGVVLTELARLVDKPAARRDLAALLGLSLDALEEEEAIVLVRYLAGPKLAQDVAPMRRQRLQLFWSGRRSGLLKLIRGPRFCRLTSAQQADYLRDFLHGRRFEVFFLDATSVNGHGAVVFGAPSDPKSLSYGRRWVLAQHKKPVARIYNPDPSVRSAWRTPSDADSTAYAFSAFRISRLLELTMIEHVERTYVVSDDQRVGTSALGAQRRMSIGQAELLRQSRDLLEQLAAHSGGIERRDGYLRGGREDVATKKRDSNALLAQFLQA